VREMTVGAHVLHGRQHWTAPCCFPQKEELAGSAAAAHRVDTRAGTRLPRRTSS